MNSRTELKPCPNCGSAAKLRAPGAYVDCDGCGLIGPRNDPTGSKWNALPRRASQPTGDGGEPPPCAVCGHPKFEHCGVCYAGPECSAIVPGGSVCKCAAFIDPRTVLPRPATGPDPVACERRDCGNRIKPAPCSCGDGYNPECESNHGATPDPVTVEQAVAALCRWVADPERPAGDTTTLRRFLAQQEGK